MSQWQMKRFWKEAKTAPCDGGFEVLLDGRRVKTPAKAALVLPSEGLAGAIAAEWDRQEEKIDPSKMPLTRTANSAIDKVAVQFSEVAGLMAEYGGSDLLCYRAEQPQGLRDAQAAAWDPLLEWATQTYAAPMQVGYGVMHILQPQASLENIAKPLNKMTAFELAAFHDLVTISGSFIIALAVYDGAISTIEGWEKSRIDEEWQAAEWGRDDEADAIAALKKTAFEDAGTFLTLLK